MIIGYWDHDEKCCIQDNRMLDVILASFVEKKCSIDRVMRELASSINSNSTFYVIRDHQTIPNSEEDTLHIWDVNGTPDNALWYCYTAIDKIKNNHYQNQVVPIDARSFFERALEENVCSIWINPSAPSCAGLSVKDNNNDIKRVLAYADEAQKKELKDLASAFSVEGRMLLVESPPAENEEPTSIIRIFEAATQDTLTIADTETGKYYTINAADRKKIRGLANK